MFSSLQAAKTNASKIEYIHDSTSLVSNEISLYNFIVQKYIKNLLIVEE